MTMRIAHIASMGVLGLALGAFAPAARAQGTAPETAPETNADVAQAEGMSKREAKKLARERFFESQEHMQKEQYDEAIAALEAAYALDPQELHLFNLGLANYLRGAKEQSLDYFQKFLAENPRDRGLLREARRFVGILERDVAIIKEARAQSQELVTKTEQEAAAARAEAERAGAARREAEEQSAAARAQSEQAQAERDRWKQLALERPRGAGTGTRVLGTSVIALGALAVGVGAYYGLEARAANDELEDATAWQVSYDWYAERGERFDRRAMLFSVAGAGMIAAGATLYYLGEREARRAPSEQDALRLAPAVGADGAGVEIMGRF